MSDSILVARRFAMLGLCAAFSSALAQPGADEAALEQIIVRGARTPVAASRTGSSFTILEPATVDPAGRATVGDLLRSTAGVALSRAGGYGALTQLRMRGGEANHVAVFVDGVRVNDPSQSGEFDFAHLLADNVERVEVIRGPQSALWGSDSLTGVINVVSARPRRGLSAEASLETGSQAWRRINAGIGNAGERGHFRLNAAGVSTDGYNVSRQGGERDGYDNASVSFGASFAPTPDTTLSFRLRSIDSSTQFDGTDFATGLPADSLDTTDKEQSFGGLGFAADTFDGRWHHEFSIDRFDTDNVTSTQNDFAETGFDRISASAVVDTVVYQTHFDLNDSHRLIAAFEHRDERFRQRGPVTFGDPNRDEGMDTDSLILEYDARISERFSLLTSLRGDANSAFDDATTARVSLAWRLSNLRTRLRAAWGEGIKNPTFTERFGFFTDFLGNPDLRPERSRSSELGLDHEFAEAQLQLSATLFDETLEEEINGFVFDPARGGFTALNQQGESRRTGLEVEGDWRSSQAFGVSFSMTWLDAREPDASGADAVAEIRRPGHVAGLRLRWTPPGQRLDFGLSVDYSSSQDDFYFPPVPPFQERVELEAFTLATLSMAYSVGRSLRVFGRLENLLNTEYEEVFGYRGAERQVFVGLSYGFDSNR